MAVSQTVDALAIATYGDHRLLRGECQVVGDASGGSLTLTIQLPRRLDRAYVLKRLGVIGPSSVAVRLGFRGQFMGGDVSAFPNAWALEDPITTTPQGYISAADLSEVMEAFPYLLWVPADAQTDTPKVDAIFTNAAASSFGLAVEFIDMALEDFVSPPF